MHDGISFSWPSRGTVSFLTAFVFILTEVPAQNITAHFPVCTVTSILQRVNVLEPAINMEDLSVPDIQLPPQNRWTPKYDDTPLVSPVSSPPQTLYNRR